MTANVSCLVKVNLLICEGSKKPENGGRKMTLEEQIKHYRKQAGLSQEKMAEKIGVSRQAITKWENGTGTPDIANLMAIADLFQISVDELLSNEKSEKSSLITSMKVVLNTILMVRRILISSLVGHML